MTEFHFLHKKQVIAIKNKPNKLDSRLADMEKGTTWKYLRIWEEFVNIVNIILNIRVEMFPFTSVLHQLSTNYRGRFY